MVVGGKGIDQNHFHEAVAADPGSDQEGSPPDYCLLPPCQMHLSTVSVREELVITWISILLNLNVKVDKSTVHEMPAIV